MRGRTQQEVRDDLADVESEWPEVGKLHVDYVALGLIDHQRTGVKVGVQERVRLGQEQILELYDHSFVMEL